MHTGSWRATWLALFASLACLACQSSGHGRSFLIFGGKDSPQEDLVERVRAARSEGTEAQRDFSAAFQLYQRLTTPQAVELDDLCGDFEDALDSCEDRAHDLAERIELVQHDSDELFKGWNDELASFSGDALRKKSEAMLQDTRTRTQRVIAALERVQGRMDPVMQKLRDYALFFHHNLNARAIATLEDTYKDFDAEFHALQSELEKTESEIAAFVATFEEPTPAPAKK